MDSVIVKEVSVRIFKQIVLMHCVVVGSHALHRLNAAQRQIFHEGTLLKMLAQEIPKFVGLQRNGRYAAFFRKKQGFIKIITEIKEDKLEIVTFMKTGGIPKRWEQKN
ncbi:MAG TPA: hypothetical protein VJK52_04260 [Candidatus Nanoarchaeia archaeon]|nr:hypothetical protein [Candidatus Nanoarchaeia archaeon]